MINANASSCRASNIHPARLLRVYPFHHFKLNQGHVAILFIIFSIYINHTLSLKIARSAPKMLLHSCNLEAWPKNSLINLNVQKHLMLLVNNYCLQIVRRLVSEKETKRQISMEKSSPSIQGGILRSKTRFCANVV